MDSSYSPQSSTAPSDASIGASAARRTDLVALAFAGALLWITVALRYEALSAVPLRPGLLVLRVGLLTLGHLCIGSSLAWALGLRDRRDPERWAWCLLLGYGTLPSVLWIADRFGARPIGWGVLALLALGGLVRLGLRWKRREAAGTASLSEKALVPLALLVCLAAAAMVGLDHIVYARPGPQGIVLTLPEDNLVHAAFALEWARQQPFEYLMQAFAPEQVGIAYHYLTDVQIAAWWTLTGGDHLDFVQRERFVLQGFALLVALYLFARSVLHSRSWALVTVALFAAFPYWFLEFACLPQKESLQRLWVSFTFENGATFAAAFLAALLGWLQRGESVFARVAFVLAGMLLLAKLYFALLAWAAACALVLWLRPRAWILWLACLALLGAGLVALQPHGAGIITLRPEWAPGRFWSSLFGAGAANDDRGLAVFLEWTEVGLVLLACGCASAGLALGRCWPQSAPGRNLALLVVASWVTFLAYASAFWFLDAHQTVFQFLPWLAIVSVLAGLAGLRVALNRWLAGRRGWRTGAALAGAALWALVLALAWRNTDGFARREWTTHAFSTDSWAVLDFLRTRTPASARVLAPFESAAAGAVPSPYAISGVAGRRAVNEHSGLAVFLPGFAERTVRRKQQVGEFYRDPRADALRELARVWELDYAILPARGASASGKSVFSTPQWSVVELPRPVLR